MKRTLLTFVCILTTVASFALTQSKIRQHARFLSDRMAYELDLTPYQYDDVYEINYDFITAVERLMDDVVYGYTDAIDRYYTCLDFRNDDLRYVLSNSQYSRFLMSDYFYRPIYSTGRDWRFRIYTIYSNSSFFYFDRPAGYSTYRGDHNRYRYTNGFYVSRNYGDRYATTMRIHGGQEFDRHRRSDFGANLTNRTANVTGGRGHGYTIEPRMNNYSNDNQRNRTQDSRYRDNSGNQFSPQINNRNNSAGYGNGNQQNMGQNPRPNNGQQMQPQSNNRNNAGQQMQPQSNSRSGGAATGGTRGTQQQGTVTGGRGHGTSSTRGTR